MRRALAEGPSGRNDAYVFELADALRALDIEDPHVFDIELAVRTFASRAATR